MNFEKTGVIPLSLERFKMKFENKRIFRKSVPRTLDHFSLPADEWRKVLNFITWARTGYSKEELRKKGISDDKPGNLNDFFYDMRPRPEEQLNIFKMKNSGSTLDEADKKKLAEKIDSFPLAQVITNAILPTQI